MDGPKTGYKPVINKPLRLDDQSGESTYKNQRAPEQLRQHVNKFELLLQHACNKSLNQYTNAMKATQPEIWVEFSDWFESIKKKYKLKNDIDLLSWNVCNFEQAKLISGDVKEMCKTTKFGIRDTPNKAVFIHQCQALLNDNPSSVRLLAFCHLCLSCNVELNFPNKLQGDSPLQFIDALLVNLPKSMPKLNLCKPSDQECSILIANPWVLACLGLLLHRLNDHPKLPETNQRDILEHLMKTGKDYNILETPVPKDKKSLKESIRDGFRSVFGMYQYHDVEAAYLKYRKQLKKEPQEQVGKEPHEKSEELSEHKKMTIAVVHFCLHHYLRKDSIVCKELLSMFIHNQNLWK